ncbi:hypothetical protein MKQ70_14845 [Chitinophaga sedimenti]|uniref:hypothetical protein n=1 Tax=Chitinophaga sedimenti TaxID=2033606 RepID=UPI002004EA0E|nr:hypothetical protein [Chitinophaga sedimenti]MCK7556221.1 hypothetical protein [Chitinophaga sedimenti]
MKKKYLLLTLLFFSLHAAGQEIKIDLSKGKEFTQTISPQSFSSIILQNTLVDGKYVVKVIKEIVPFSPRPYPVLVALRPDRRAS